MEDAYATFKPALSEFVRAIMADRPSLPLHGVALVAAAKTLLDSASNPADPVTCKDAIPRLDGVRKENETRLLGLLRTVAAQSKLLAADPVYPVTELSTCVAELNKLVGEWMAQWRDINSDVRLAHAMLAPASQAPKAYIALKNVARTLVMLVIDAMGPFSSLPAPQVLDHAVAIAKQAKALVDLWKLSCDDVQLLIQDDGDGTILDLVQRLLLDTKLLVTISNNSDEVTNKPSGDAATPVRCQVIRSATGLAEFVIKWVGEYYSTPLEPVRVSLIAKHDDALAALLDNASTPRSVSTIVMSSPTTASMASESALDSPASSPFPVTKIDANPDNSPATSQRPQEVVPHPLSPADLCEKATLNKKYNALTLEKWSAKFFVVAHANFDGASHGQTSLSFKCGDLIAVYDNDDTTVWQGVNLENDEMGYFPRQFVTIINESTKLLQPKEAHLVTTPSLEKSVSTDVLSPSDNTDREQQEEIRRMKEAMKIKAPPPDKSGLLKLQVDRKKWADTQCVVKNHMLFFSKPTSKKGVVPQLMSVPLPGLLLRPALLDEVSKSDVDLAMVLANPKTGDTYVFCGANKADKASWMEAITLSTLAVEVSEVRRDSYSFHSESSAASTLRGRSLEGIDKKGKSTFTAAGGRAASELMQREEWMEGLTDEQIAHFQNVMPSKKNIEKMSGTKSVRRSFIF